MVVAPDGDVVVEADDADDVVLDAVIDREAVGGVRRTNPSLANRRL
jgi:predicted amidohydrolase